MKLRENRDCKKSCVYKGNFFPDMNQICKNLLSDVLFMFRISLYSHIYNHSYGLYTSFFHFLHTKQDISNMVIIRPTPYSLYNILRLRFLANTLLIDG